MAYYDMVMESCSSADSMAKLLGYNKIMVAGRDFKLADAGKDVDVKGMVAISDSPKELIKAAKRLASAVIPFNLQPDRLLVSALRDNDVTLLIPFSIIVSARGLAMSRNLHYASKLLAYARKKKVNVGFITLARSTLYMESYMQLIGLAKLIGASEEEARLGI
ncbi:MAG: hypothetical protein QXW10_00660, partial [Candidatus Micrarchaeaceae archaeon]